MDGISMQHFGLTNECAEVLKAEARHVQSPTYAPTFQVPTDVEKCQDRMECFNADLKADMERWQNNKRQDFRQLLMGLADKNIQYYEKVKRGQRSFSF